MASYLGHLSCASVLGAAYGSAAVWMGMDWGAVFLGAGLTTLGGLLPDVDSDSSVPVREMFGIAAVAGPLLLVRRFEAWGLSVEQLLVVLAGLYLLIRYGLSRVFKHFTVHRGVFHSIPALLIAGLSVFLLYGSEDVNLRLFLAGGIMLGFLSHLLLDEFSIMDFEGAPLEAGKRAVSALKFRASSWQVTTAAYVTLLFLAGLTALEVGALPKMSRSHSDATLSIPSPPPADVEE